MITDPLQDPELLSRLDAAEFPDRLQTDDDGSFSADVETYLNAWKAQIKSWQVEGVSPIEYDQLDRLESGIEAAQRVIQFFVMLKKLPPM
jgi:hypothetical protein